MLPTSRFVFTLCQPGAEAALKRELGRVQPTWAAAYQRPGLVTFRLPESASVDVALDAVFSRQHGVSLGTIADMAAFELALSTLPTPVCLHVVARDPAQAATASVCEQALRARFSECFQSSSIASEGALVLSVVVADGERMLLGCHRQQRLRCPLPGGVYTSELPPEAPSRAYLKIEEAIATFGLPIRAGDTALEIGAAPGGAAYALLRRGVHVIGVDPGAMDPRVLAYEGVGGARLRHLPIAVAELARTQLPERIDWLLVDVHLAPQIALRAARRLASQLRGTLCGAVLTLKLNDWSFAESIPSFLQQASEMGLIAPRARQLASNRQELAIAGLTKRGANRV